MLLNYGVVCSNKETSPFYANPIRLSQEHRQRFHHIMLTLGEGILIVRPVQCPTRSTAVSAGDERGTWATATWVMARVAKDKGRSMAAGAILLLAKQSLLYRAPDVGKEKREQC